jgi:putative membrane protein
MKLAIALATACALLSAPAFAQSQTAPSTTGATIGTVPTRYLVPHVIMANMFDVQLARLAEQKGDSADKTFAQQDTGRCSAARRGSLISCCAYWHSE